MARKNHQILKGLAIALCCFLFAKCKEKTVIPPVVINTQKGDVLIINEGNFNWGNASLSLYNPNDKSIQNEVFKSANNINIGDVAQSVALVNGDWWIVVNNSGKIVILDTANFKLKKTISGLNSPRYLCKSNNIVYVTDLYAEKLTIINPFSFSISKTISLPGWTEEIIEENNLIYVLNKDSSSIYISNSAVDSFFKDKEVSNPMSLVKTDLGGMAISKNSNSLAVTNLRNKKVYLYPKLKDANKVCINKVGTLGAAIVGNDVYLFEPNQPSKRVISLSANINTYGMAIINDLLYLSDAKDFSQKSEISVYDLKGQLITKVRAGINTNGFVAK